MNQKNFQRFRFKVALIAVSFLFAETSFAQSFKFDFGEGKAQSGFIKIDNKRRYSDENLYGFDLQTQPDSKNTGIQKGLKSDCVYSKSPFYFSVKVPEGNYKIKALFGSSQDSGHTTVKAESRRLMLQDIKTKPGEFREEVFVVNIKNKNIDGNNQVALKPRELTKLDWDDKLTLEFDINTYLCALEIERVENYTTLFLAGNSTVVNQEEEPWASWGQMIPRFFGDGIAVANHAESGLALGSFLSSKRLDKILSVAKPSDYLFIEFGHNDQKEKGENSGAYKSYSERLRLFVNKFKAVGGIPVIVTSTSRRSFDAEGKLNQTLGDFPDAARQVALELNVPLIDLNLMTKTFYEALGVERSKLALVHYPAHTFPNQEQALADNTHFNTYGAFEISKMVLRGIIENKLAIKNNIKDFEGYHPGKPDDPSKWFWPLSPINSILKPDGS
ncbi:lipolytic protein G-D-S-L family [Pseudopedobacter saltans DSM 12145]|uniref:Lipolytic protein G-D-S-L family n=1 Tax=Pseudopedobacter saltans (strain ATCC 51119 / DSM 12145 / JCM 21818 / CCUG 39354 / LMG 10337 / NBRC 100064 / NCIMB 13643) TaxID=762903 RepID=F0S5Q5_PSESL|nr:rhamnogalacturonan acetylesterase [Pseudopedobacter saltans]ADY54229.1 lipolytic protein G-D-S-L family [Pseudopedobacter saltans DSM 12145]